MRYLPLAFLVGTIVAVVLMPSFKVAGIRWPEKSILTLEIPKDDAELRGLLRSGDAVNRVRANTKWDYAFIVVYTLLFISLAIQMPPMPRAMTIVVAVATAALDVWEDRVIERFLMDPEHAVAAEIWLPARAKWFGFFVAVGLVAVLFQQWPKWALVLIGVAGAVASLLGYRIGISVATDLAILALAVAVIAFTFGFGAPPTSRSGIV
jgi:hypothetical protein